MVNIEIVMHKAIYCLAFVLGLSYSYNLISCPLRVKEWKTRAEMMNCGPGLFYHCLIDFNGNSTEFCLQEKVYDGGGCPKVLKAGDRYILSQKLTSCGNKNYCPKEDKMFHSNELYKYPACLVREEERQNFTLPDPVDVNITKTDGLNKNEQSTGNDGIKTGQIIGILIGIVLVAAVVCLIVFLIWKKRKGGNNRNILSPYKEQTYKWDTWKIGSAIRDRDDPLKVEELYSSLKGMEERYYKECLPEDVQTVGSFLRYAVLKERERTILFFLQSYLSDNLHVFAEDTYDAKRDADILQLAEKKGWTDVIAVLQKCHDRQMNDEKETHESMKLVGNDDDT